MPAGLTQIKVRRGDIRHPCHQTGGGRCVAAFWKTPAVSISIASAMKHRVGKIRAINQYLACLCSGLNDRWPYKQLQFEGAKKNLSAPVASPNKDHGRANMKYDYSGAVAGCLVCFPRNQAGIVVSLHHLVSVHDLRKQEAPDCMPKMGFALLRFVFRYKKGPGIGHFAEPAPQHPVRQVRLSGMFPLFFRPLNFQVPQ